MDGRDDSGFNPYLRHHVGAPEKHYARLRAGGSVQWSRAASTWVVTGYAEALAVLRSPDFVAPDLRAIVRKLAERAKRPLPHVDQFLLATLMFNETADHAVLRRLLARLIGSQPMAVVGSIAEAVAAELWQAARQRGRIDLAGEFAELLPSRVMGRIFGITENERLRFAEFTHGLMAVLNQGCALSIYETLNAQLAEGLRSEIGALAVMAEPRMSVGDLPQPTGSPEPPALGPGRVQAGQEQHVAQPSSGPERR